MNRLNHIFEFGTRPESEGTTKAMSHLGCFKIIYIRKIKHLSIFSFAGKIKKKNHHCCQLWFLPKSKKESINTRAIIQFRLMKIFKKKSVIVYFPISSVIQSHDPPHLYFFDRLIIILFACLNHDIH